MNGRTFTFGTSTNPVVQALYLLLGGVLLIAAVLMGAVILAFALGFLLIFGIVFWIRIWWLRRKFMRAGGRPPGAGGPGPSSGEVIEVEYTVVDERDSKDRHD